MPQSATVFTKLFYFWRFWWFLAIFRQIIPTVGWGPNHRSAWVQKNYTKKTAPIGDLTGPIWAAMSDIGICFPGKKFSKNAKNWKITKFYGREVIFWLFTHNYPPTFEGLWEHLGKLLVFSIFDTFLAIKSASKVL